MVTVTSLQVNLYQNISRSLMHFWTQYYLMYIPLELPNDRLLRVGLLLSLYWNFATYWRTKSVLPCNYSWRKCFEHLKNLCRPWDETAAHLKAFVFLLSVSGPAKCGHLVLASPFPGKQKSTGWTKKLGMMGIYGSSYDPIGTFLSRLMTSCWNALPFCRVVWKHD